MVVKIIFRTYDNGRTLGLLPHTFEEYSGMVTAYDGEDFLLVEPNEVISETKPSEFEEYEDIQLALEEIGFKLKIVKRFTIKK